MERVFPWGSGTQVRRLWRHRIAMHVPTHSDLMSKKYLNVSLHGRKPLEILLGYLLYTHAQQMTIPASRHLKLRSCRDLHRLFASQTAKCPMKIKETAYWKCFMQFWISLELSQETTWLDISLSVTMFHSTVQILLSCQPIRAAELKLSFCSILALFSLVIFF